MLVQLNNKPLGVDGHHTAWFGEVYVRVGDHESITPLDVQDGCSIGIGWAGLGQAGHLQKVLEGYVIVAGQRVSVFKPGFLCPFSMLET